MFFKYFLFKNYFQTRLNEKIQFFISYFLLWFSLNSHSHTLKIKIDNIFFYLSNKPLLNYLKAQFLHYFHLKANKI